jgi:hypothetical protein
VLHSEIQQSKPYQHRIFRPALPATDQAQLHIYIEGDGRPWRARYFIAPDPTPEYALMLEAMLKDSAPSLYLGRPCYFHTDDTACSATDWTMGRYSNAVVQSMAHLVDSLAADYPSLWLIGHSGGGTLAVLIGRRLQRPVNVLTIAANLDHQAWTAHHQYTPLWDSLDVATDVARNPAMRELHWTGSADENVLPQWNEDYCRQRQVPCRNTEANHASGWLRLWPTILESSASVFDSH